MTFESISHSFEALDYDARQHLAQIPKIIFRHSYEEPDNAASEGNQSDADELMISNLSPLSDDFVRLDDLVFTVMATQSDVQIKQKKLSEFLGQLASRFTNHAR